MATQTSNLGLTKPAYSETADIADINNNMDKVDAAVNGVQNGMAILANGNVHSAVTSGQYVYVRNHGTLAEGLYTATTNISTNATLSTSNLTAVPNNGALNTLRDDVTSLNSKMTQNDLGTISSLPDLSICRNGLISFAISAQIVIEDVYLPAGTRFIGCNYSNIAHFAVMPNNNNFYVVRYSSDNGWIVLKRL